MRGDVNTTRAILAGIVLTVAALGLREVLPQRTVDLTAPPYWHYLSAPAEPVDRVQWVDERKLHWRCSYRADDRFAYQPCGLAIVLGDGPHGLDLRRFRSITLDLAYRGSAGYVRLALRSFDPRFSRLSDGNSARIQSVNLRARDIAGPVTVGLSELTVPEWWITQYNLPREFNIARLDNVVSLTIDLPYGIQGAPQDLEVRGVSLQADWIARDTLYFAVLCAWIVGALIVIGRRNVRLRAEHAQLHRQAHVDALTGVLNRRGIEQALSGLIEQRRQFALIVLDLDHFKRVNDTHGHDAGDDVLSRAAALVIQGVRAGDVVGRWGGEEFVVACIDCPAEQAVHIAQKMRLHIETCTFGRGIAVTASIGVSAAAPGAPFEEVFRRADTALYRAKTGGRNRVFLDDAAQDRAVLA
jgi:diguanylate cyclase (GGDEF)-like protein